MIITTTAIIIIIMNIIITIIIYIAIVPNIIFLIINISAKTAHCFYEVSLSLFLVLSVSSLLLIGSTRPPLGIDTLPQYYHTVSFNYGGIKVRDVDQIVDFIRAIFPMISISCDN